MLLTIGELRVSAHQGIEQGLLAGYSIEVVAEMPRKDASHMAVTDHKLNFASGRCLVVVTYQRVGIFF